MMREMHHSRCCDLHREVHHQTPTTGRVLHRSAPSCTISICTNDISIRTGAGAFQVDGCGTEHRSAPTIGRGRRQVLRRSQAVADACARCAHRVTRFHRSCVDLRRLRECITALRHRASREETPWGMKVKTFDPPHIAFIRGISYRHSMRAQAIGYIRVSTLDQASEGYSLEQQRQRLLAEAKQRGWTIEVVADEGESGGRLERPGLHRALRMLEQGEAQVLVVAKLDRLSRSLSDFASLTTRARQQGWAVVALDLGVDMTTPAGQLMANVMASFAEYERHLIRERTHAGREQKAREGVGWVTGRPPYGYRCDSGTLVPQQEHAEVVRLIFAWAAQGYADKLIADELATRGHLSPGGEVWEAQAVRRIRRRSVYSGEYRWRGHVLRCDPIVSRKVWRRAQHGR